jgi:hypothetical protein
MAHICVVMNKRGAYFTTRYDEAGWRPAAAMRRRITCFSKADTSTEGGNVGSAGDEQYRMYLIAMRTAFPP